MIVQCDKCGKTVNTAIEYSYPAILGFQLENGKMINLCYGCICDLGTATQTGKGMEEWERFLQEAENDA